MLIFNLLLIVLSNAVTIRRDKSILYNRIAILALILSMVDIYISLVFKAFDKGIGLYNGLFFATSSSTVFQIFIYLLCIIILQLTSFFPRKIFSQESFLEKIFKNSNINIKNKYSKIGEQFKIIEYPLILLFIILGANFLISSSDIISIFIAIELQSYGLYLLCTMYRNSESATSAGLTYFLLGGLSSCFILLGIALIYANLGVTYLDSFYVINNLAGILDEQVITTYIPCSLLLISIGFLFKISAAPFHF
jgi:NADH-ubiquinone oxidoreductase chain 2